MTIDSILKRQMHFVSGKGGVGKSTLSCLLARYFASQGLPTLLIQINAKDAHSGVLGTEEIGPHIQQLGPYLWAFNADPKECVQEYLMTKLHSKRLYNILFNNGLIRSFLNFLPSLNELAMLGKIWFHANEKEKGKARFERLVVDCPATGHGLHLLKVPQNTYEAVRIGPIAQEAQKMAEQMNSTKHSALHIVTWPEELPISEAIEMAQEVKNKKNVALGFVVVNGVQEKLINFQIPPFQLDQDESSLELVALVRNRAELEIQQAAELERLKNELKAIPCIELPLRQEGHISPKVFGYLEAAFRRAIK